MPQVALADFDAQRRAGHARVLRAGGYRVDEIEPSADQLRPGTQAVVIAGCTSAQSLQSVCRGVRSAPAGSEAPLIVIARGDDAVAMRSLALAAGADVVLTEPVTGELLAAQLDALFRFQRRCLAAGDAEQLRGELEAVFNATSEGVTVFDMQGNVVLLNRSQAKINGFATREEMLRNLEFYSKVYELSTLDRRVLPVEQWPVSRVSRGESLQQVTLRGLRRDTGQSWYFEFSGEPVYDPEGRQILSIVITRDITRQRIIEERLTEAKEIAERHRVEQEAIVNSMTEGLVVFEPSGHLLHMNPAALAIHRFKSVEAVRMHLGKFPEVNVLQRLDGTPLPLEDWPISRALRGETFSNYEVLVRPADGGPPWYGSYGGAPVSDNEGRMVLAIVTLRDVTPQKQAEEMLRQNEAALESANAELERKVEERTAELRASVAELEHFSYTLTHDMRAPLRAMHAFGDILHQRYAESLDATGRDYLRRIVQSAGRMDALITDALDYSKVVRSAYALQPVDPMPLLRGIVESYPELQPPQAEIVLEDSLPSVLGNRAGLTQAFANLLTNAVKFVAPGVVPRVRVRGEVADNRVRLWFEDNGIGIAPEQQRRIFGMFERLSTSYPGTGVGLALVQKVMERMRGSVGVESRVGEGSRFWLEFLPPKATERIPSP